MRMEIKKVALVLVDISGYTRFIKHRQISLLHAEQIITELIEAIIDTAEYPLALNKLEGDAAFLYTPIEANESAAAQDVVRQTVRFFEAFKRKRQEMINGVSCPCDACTHIDVLELKAFLHAGEAVIKRVRQFEELGGEDVILVHRLLKNKVEAKEYLLMTEAFHRLSGPLTDWTSAAHAEEYTAMGRVEVVVFYPQSGVVLPDAAAVQKMTMLESLRFSFAPLWRRLTGKRQSFRHLPH
jgi:hypothetical protein